MFLINPYACGVCRKSFSSAKILLGHVKFHLPANPSPESKCKDEKLEDENSSRDLQKKYKCQFCNLSFPTLPQLKVHISLIHTDKNLSAAKFSEIRFDEKENTVGRKISDKKSEEKSKKKPKKISKRIPKMISNDSDFSGIDSEDDLEPPKVNEKSQNTVLKKFLANKSLTCKYCNKSLSTPDVLKDHERTHTGEKPYTCKICNKAFFSMASLKGHRKVHDKQSSFSCKYCTKIFSYKHHLVIHERVHTGEKPFACSYCNKTFSQSQSVKTHERIHTGEHPFLCRNCEKTFKQLPLLKAHEKRKKPCKRIVRKTF